MKKPWSDDCRYNGHGSGVMDLEDSRSSMVALQLGLSTASICHSIDFKVAYVGRFAAPVPEVVIEITRLHTLDHVHLDPADRESCMETTASNLAVLLNYENYPRYPPACCKSLVH